VSLVPVRVSSWPSQRPTGTPSSSRIAIVWAAEPRGLPEQQRRTARTARQVLVGRGHLATAPDDRWDVERRSWTLQEPQTKRREHQDNSDVYDQALPEPVPEEQDVHADHDGYQRDHVKHDSCLSSHRGFPLYAVF
jgi:hypothetical protein